MNEEKRRGPHRVLLSLEVAERVREREHERRNTKKTPIIVTQV